jgi:type II secretory pathway pseudopilin PulG
VKKLAAQIREAERHARTAAGSRRREGRQEGRQESRPKEEGYILLTLLLVVALMAIFAMGVIIPIKFAMQRDQEQEMIHRGVQYSRAIRAYYRKFQRYPTKLEDLDSTNNMRFLRRRYKDPLNKNQDFRLLHYGEPGVTLGTGFAIGGGSIPGATAIGSPAGANGSSSGSSFGGSGIGGGSGFGGSSFGGSGSGGSSFGGSGIGGTNSLGGNNSGVNSSGVFAQTSGSDGSSNSGLGASSNPQSSSQNGSGQQGTNPVPGSDSAQPSSPGTGQGSDSSSGQPPLVAGGPIVGVASLSKNTTIREFNKKKKYNEWQFVYDPTTDRGGLITTPYQPALAAFGAPAALNGAQPAGTNTSPFGGTNGGTNNTPFGGSNGSSFGQSSSFGNNGNSGGSSQPSQPPSNPPQQQ